MKQTSVRLFAACVLSAMQMVFAIASEGARDIAIDTGGILPQGAAPGTRSPAAQRASAARNRPPLVFDEQGNSNQLVVRLDSSQPGRVLKQTFSSLAHSRGDFERIVVDAVSNGDPMTRDILFGAEHARHLIDGTRLSKEHREAYGPDHPRERIEQYIVLSYPTVAAAHLAAEGLKHHPAVLWVGNDRRVELSWTPSDPYFAQPPVVAPSVPGVGTYQWGMQAMSFPAAWEITRGNAYVGAADTGLLNGTAPADLRRNYRPQFSWYSNGGWLDGTEFFNENLHLHGAHVLGIIGAEANNGIGISGGCPNCSVATAKAYKTTYSCDSWGKCSRSAGMELTSIAPALLALTESGMQVVNMSLNVPEPTSTCTGGDYDKTVCQGPAADALALMAQRDVLAVASAGNYSHAKPDWPASIPSVLAVAGAQNMDPAAPSSWGIWKTGFPIRDSGTSAAGPMGVTAPAKSIVSTVPVGVAYKIGNGYDCSDDPAWGDNSGIPNDGYGTCTGTSMAAPHVSALGGLLRSANPLASAADIRAAIRNTASNSSSPNAEIGYGMPNAGAALNSMFAGPWKNKLTPLFAFYSPNRLDSFYTTVPQMATAALWGTLQPVPTTLVAGATGPDVYEPKGTPVVGYTAFPDAPQVPGRDTTPRAEAWIFTTPRNPADASIPLAPLYRLSWKCGDPTTAQPTVCNTTNPHHTDTVYTTEQAGIDAYAGLGYKLDGIEGYIYPKTMSQPAGTERLMRKYNPVRDDHAIFPESKYGEMISLGYTADSYSDWLGYVYPNVTGVEPTVVANTPPPVSTGTAPRFRAASVLNGSGTLAYPAGTVSTDWLVMYVMGAQNSVPTPSGWTLAASYVWPSSYGYPTYVFTRQAGTGSNVPLTIPYGGAFMLAYENASGIGATGSFAYYDNGTVPLSSITPRNSNSVVLGIVTDRDPVNPVPPADFVSRLNFTMTYFGNNVAEKRYGNTNPTGTATWTQNPGSYGSAGVLIEVLPAGSAPATLLSPGISATISPASVQTNTAATMTITLSNPNSIAITGAAFSNLYPPNLVNANPPAVATTCAGAVTAAAGGTSLALASGTIPASGSCTVTVAVTSAVAGSYTNTIASGALTTANAGTNTSAASAALTVTTPPASTGTVPRFRAASVLNGSGTLAYPAGTVSTDWLVMYVMGAQNTVPTPSGWTLAASYVWPSSYGYPTYVFTRQAGTGSSVPLTIPYGGAFMLAYENASGIGATGSFAYYDNGTVPLSSITPQNLNSVVLGIVTDRDPVNPVPPADFLSRLNFTMTYFGNNVAEKRYGNTNPTGTATWTQNPGSYGSAGVLIEVLPAGGP